MRDTTDGGCRASIRNGTVGRPDVACVEVRRAVGLALTLPPVRRERVEAARRGLLRGQRTPAAQIADAILRR